MRSRTKVLVISIGFVTDRNPSDKQFVSDLIRCVDPDIDIALWSLNDAFTVTKIAKFGDRTILYKNQNRIFHSPLFEDGKAQYRPHSPHSTLRSAFELNASIAWCLFRDLGELIKSYKPDVVHLTDSIGPVAYLLNKILGEVPMSMTKPTVRENLSSGLGAYRTYVASSIVGIDRVITFTHVAAKWIGKLGSGGNKISVIPWGVFVPENSLSYLDKSEIRHRYGCKPNDVLVVIAKRSSDDEFKKTLILLHEISRKLNMKFVVAMKPTRFSSSWLDYSYDAVVVENGPSDYYELLEAADALFSPVGREASQSSSLLPLTWLEGMVRETPVITRCAPGVEDLIEDGKTGLLYVTESELEACFLKLKDEKNLLRLQSAARELVVSRYDVKRIAKCYSLLWKDLADYSKRSLSA